MRKMYAEQAPSFLAHYLPGLAEDQVRYVPHHVAHAASAGLAAPYPTNSVLVLDGRGEAVSHLAGRYTDGRARGAGQPGAAALPRPAVRGPDRAPRASCAAATSTRSWRWPPTASRASPASSRRPSARPATAGSARRRSTSPSSRPGSGKGDEWTEAHADLAASVQLRLEEVLLDLVRWLHGRTGDTALTLAGGVALNCVANTRIHAEGPFEHVWVQPAAGDSGTALGGALYVARDLGDADRADARRRPRAAAGPTRRSRPG